MENIQPDPEVTAPLPLSNLDAALALAAAGLFVFPAGVAQHVGSDKWLKKPLIGGWQSKATSDASQIRQWWQTCPHAVPGIELGRSGLVVLDGDRHGGPDGVTALNDTLGADTPRHPISLTAGGGEHHIFRQPLDGNPLGNSTGSLPPGIDVRGQGGWIVAPGSIRPDGKLWQSDPDAPSLSEAFSSGTIPVIPEAVVNLIRTAPASAPPLAAPLSQSISQRAIAQVAPPTGRSLSYGKVLLAGVCSKVSEAREGTRNTTLNACSHRVGRAIASGIVCRGEAEQALLRAAAECGLVADGEAAVRATIRSGLNAGALKPLPPLADRALPQTTEGEPSTVRPPFALHWHDNDNALVMPKWLLKKMLPESGVAVLAGQWSAGKTFVALHLAECVATGKPFAGRKIKRRGGALFLAAEAAGDIPIRLRGITDAQTPKQEQLPFAWSEEVPRISEAGALQRMIEIASDAAAEMQKRFGLPLALIVIDTMAAAAGFENENDAAQVQAVMNVLHGLSRATGALVIAVDHFGKTVDNGTRGSSAKEASADAVLALLTSQTLEGVVEQRTLAIRKLRGGSTGDQIPFTLKPVSLGIDEDLEAITTCIVEFSSDPVVGPAAKDRWKGLMALKKALLVALAEDQREIRPFGYEGAAVNAVPLKAVREEYYKACPADGDDAVKKKETRRKALYRALEKATERQLICTRDIGGEDWIWMVASPVSAAPSRSSPDKAAGLG